GANELGQLHGLAGLELYRVDLVVGEKDIVALFVFEAFDDLVLVDRTDASHHFFVVDRLAAWFMDLSEARLGVRPGGAEQLNGNRNERKTKLAFPDRTRGGHDRELHTITLSLQRRMCRRVPRLQEPDAPQLVYGDAEVRDETCEGCAGPDAGRRIGPGAGACLLFRHRAWLETPAAWYWLQLSRRKR